MNVPFVADTLPADTLPATPNVSLNVALVPIMAPCNSNVVAVTLVVLRFATPTLPENVAVAPVMFCVIVAKLAVNRLAVNLGALNVTLGLFSINAPSSTMLPVTANADNVPTLVIFG